MSQKLCLSKIKQIELPPVTRRNTVIKEEDLLVERPSELSLQYDEYSINHGQNISS